MGKVRYSKKTTPPPISSSLRLKKSVCVILPRVDVTEFLRERRRRSLSLQQSAPSSSGGSPSVSVVPSGSVRITKRRFRIKKEPPCIFHSQVDITDNNAEEIPGVLDQSVQSDSLCVHDITKSMCYMCSPRPTVEDKSEVWNEINDTTTRLSTSSEYRSWHIPTPFIPSTSSSGQPIEETNLADNTQQSVQIETSRQIEPNNTTEIGVGTGNDLIPTDRRDQSTQTIRYFSCKHCMALFTDVAHLIHHKTVHQKMFECPFCTANFISKNDLKSHMKLHMLPKYYDCVYCTQAFTKKHDIREHLNLHAEQKQFHCQQCPARFPQKNNLRNHEESHNVSKFIHVFKKIDDNEPVDKSTSPTKTGRRSAGSISNANVAGSSAASSNERKTAKLPRRLVSGIQRITPTPIITPTPPGTLRPPSSMVRKSYLAMSSIRDTPSTPNNSAASASTSTSAGPNTSSVSSSTNTETPVVPEIQASGNNVNFFQCRFCPLSCKNYQSFKAHIVCHTRKKGKFNCPSCGGNFIRKSGLSFHIKHSHTIA